MAGRGPQASPTNEMHFTAQHLVSNARHANSAFVVCMLSVAAPRFSDGNVFSEVLLLTPLVGTVTSCIVVPCLHRAYLIIPTK
jgi:hypothetical protein